METQRDLKLRIHESFDKYRKRMPEISRAYDVLPDAVYKDGALSEKTKRLMALCGALVHGCVACELFQAEKALEAGASVEEILETCSVAISLCGTMGAGETTRVVEFLSEKGLM